MIHRTFRSLDQPPKLLGFTIAQWAVLIAAATVLGGLAYALRLPVKVAITLLVLTLGVPAALLYVSEAGGPPVGRVLLDLLRWRGGVRTLPAHGAALSRRQRAAVEQIPGVSSLSAGGLLERSDGCLVRYLAVSPVNPMVLDPQEAGRLSDALTQLAARLEDGQSLQLYASARHLDTEELVAEHAGRCEQAASSIGDGALAQATRGLGSLAEDSLARLCERERPLTHRYLVICPWGTRPARWPRRPDAQDAPGESLRHSEGVRSDLEAAGLEARLLDGGEVLELLGERLDPAQAAQRRLAEEDFLEAGGSDTLGSALRPGALHADAQHLRLGGRLERCLYLSLAPEQTWLGWLLHLMVGGAPFSLSVHVTATDRHRERTLQRRRYRRVYGVNRGVEARGQLLDPDARLHEQDALELNDALASSSAAGIYRLGIYVSYNAPATDARWLEEVCRAAGRELEMASDARVQHGPFAQLPLWRSSLPLGAETARRRRKYVAVNVGDSFPCLGATCSSREGIPLGVAFPGRSMVRLDPFDPLHPNHLLLVNGMSGAGKTMSAIVMLARAISHGASGAVIDRAGHFEFLASLLPGAGTVALGAGHSDAINCWDVTDPAAVGPEKVDYLLALHALLLGEHDQARDSYGLTDLEANLLGLAIGEVYSRCAETGEQPRELLLQQQLEQRFERERSDGSVGIAEALRNLSMRLSNYIGEGPYAYLTDRQTTVAPGAPLVVFDTRSIPEAKAAAALFVICEHVKSRIQTLRAEHLQRERDQSAGVWAGRSFLVIDEAWKLIERPATGRWFNEFCRRSRHYALWLVAISQQLSDFENEHGRALLSNATMRLFLRQEARELAYVRDALGLSEPALAAIGELSTVKGSHADSYLVNGLRGQGNVRITLGPGEYWLASSDPARDEPLRRAALRDADGDPWRALRALAAMPPTHAGEQS